MRSPLVPCLWAVFSVVGRGAPAPAQIDHPAESAQAGSRVVHRFDFLEPDNLDAEAKYWIRLPDASLPIYPDPVFPRYTEAYRDMRTGHEAAPSFYLSSKGRNVAFRYEGKETRVSPGDYLIVGWIKPDRLQRARACLSAYYLDWDSRPIPGTQRFSPLIGSAAADDEWQQVEIRLPSAGARVQAIGLTAWVVQEDIWREGLMPHRYITHVDVKGGAWFDDLVIYGVPRVQLRSAHPGNIVEYATNPRLLATVCDEKVDGLTARLSVRDADRRMVWSTDVPARGMEQAGPTETEVSVPPLTPGIYHAALEAFSQNEPIIEQSLTFAVLGETRRPGGLIARRWGTIVRGPADTPSPDVLGLVRGLGVGAVKLPLWTGDPANPGYEADLPGLHELLNELVRSRVAVIGVFAGPPAGLVRTVGEYARSLLDILSEDPRGWKDYLGAMVAPYASIFRSWQLGADGDERFIADQRLPTALRATRDQMRTLITSPNLTAIALAGDMPPTDLPPVDQLSVELPDDVHPPYVHEQLQPFLTAAPDRLWVTVALPRLENLDRTAAVTDWALRLIEARWSGPNIVFLPQPWISRGTAAGRVAEPTEEYLFFRTIVDTLGDSAPSVRVKVGGTAQGISFTENGQAVVVLWDPEAPPEGSWYSVQLGAAPTAVDLWGRPLKLERDADARSRLQLTRAPIFITGAEEWLLALQAGIHLTPDRMAFTFERTRLQLTVPNPHHQPISGDIRLEAPPEWTVEPRSLPFALQPGQEASLAIDVRYPNNETAGSKIIQAAVHLRSAGGYSFEVPLPVELGLPDVDVWGYAVTQQGRLVIRQGLTNRANHPLSFRGFAVYPGRSRQYRVINELLPGQTLTTEYTFTNVANAPGRSVRLGLREVNGPRIHNMEVAIP